MLLKSQASQEELDAAGRLLQAARSTLLKTKSAGDWEVARVESLWGSYLCRLGRYAEAEPLLLESHRVLREIRGEGAVYTLAAGERVRELYEVWDRPEDLAP